MRKSSSAFLEKNAINRIKTQLLIKMFGLIVSGRIVQTEFQQVSETHVMFNIPEADSINHIVIFMTGQTPFPDGMGGAVYFSWPDASGQSWHLLGYISNNKPSAIFKVAGLKKGGGSEMNAFGSAEQHHLAQIGISVEPLSSLTQQTPALDTNPSKLTLFAEYSQKMLENFYNYASSFAVTQAQMTPNPSENFVPISTLNNWFTTFQQRMQQNPYFWKN